MKVLLLISFSFLIVSCNSPTEPVPSTTDWSIITSMPIPVSGACGAYLDGKFYVLLGYAINGYITKAQIWDGSSWALSSIDSPSGAIGGMGCCVWNNKIVTSPGYGYRYTTVYDPNNNTWIQSTPYPESWVDRCTMASLNGKVYVFGGYVYSMYYTNAVYEFTPDDSVMVQKNNLPHSMAFMPAAVFDGKVYLFGGDGQGSYYGSDNIWEYDPLTDTYTLKGAHLSTLRREASAATVGKRIYIFAGEVYNEATDLVEVYDPITDTIITTTSMPFATMSQAGAGGLTSGDSGVIYVAGGGRNGTIIGDACRGVVTENPS